MEHRPAQAHPSSGPRHGEIRRALAAPRWNERNLTVGAATARLSSVADVAKDNQRGWLRPNAPITDALSASPRIPE